MVCYIILLPIHLNIVVAMHEQIFELLMKEDDISWQAILQDLITREGMDAWDVDVSKLAHSYIEMLKKMQELNLVISGKVILASAILLKMQSSKLVQEDIYRLDSIMNPPSEVHDEDDFDSGALFPSQPLERPALMPRTPQPRERKVSIYDLISALQDALEGQKRRALREILDEIPTITHAPQKKEDVTIIINRLLQKIDKFFDVTRDQVPLKFSELVPSQEKTDAVYTFIPLLQLTNDRKIDLHQEESFSDIHIMRVHLSQNELLRIEEEKEKKRLEEEAKNPLVKKSRQKPSLHKNEKKDPIDVSILEQVRDMGNQALDSDKRL